MDSNTVRGLLKLQEIDLRIQETTEKLNLIPSEISNLEKAKDELERGLISLKQKFKDLDFLKKEKELDIQDLKKKIENIEKVLEKVRTNEEYKNLLREKARAEESIIELEDEIISLMEEMENLHREIKQKEDEAKVKFKDIDEKINQVKARKTELEGLLESLNREREAVVKTLKPQDYAQYENIKKRVKTKPISIVQDSSCTGCYMVIPPKIFSELLKTDKMLNCPNCGRYLFYEKS